MRSVRASALAFVAAALAAETTTTRVQASDADKGAAQVLFEQGRALVQERRFPEACPKFAESLRLDPGIGTMLWLADCYENSGKTASAWAEFKEAAAAATLRQDPRAALARRRADDLEPKLARLVLVPPAEGSAAGMEVRRDGVVLGATELGIPVPVNPGVHEIGASATGKKTWTTAVTVVDKPATISVVIPVLEAAPEAVAGGPPTGTDGPAGGGTNAAGLPVERTWGARQTVAVATAGAGLVAIAVGSYFGLAAKASYDEWVKSGGALGVDRASASTQATASTVLFAAGAAAILSGAVVYFTTPRRAGVVAVRPIVSPWGGGMELSKTF